MQLIGVDEVVAELELGDEVMEIDLLPSSQEDSRLSSATYNGRVLIAQIPSLYFIGKNGRLQKFLAIVK